MATVVMVMEEDGETEGGRENRERRINNVKRKKNHLICETDGEIEMKTKVILNCTNVCVLLVRPTHAHRGIQPASTWESAHTFDFCVLGCVR